MRSSMTNNSRPKRLTRRAFRQVVDVDVDNHDHNDDDDSSAGSRDRRRAERDNAASAAQPVSNGHLDRG